MHIIIGITKFLSIVKLFLLAMKLGYLTKNISGPGCIKDVDGKKGLIAGYFAHFNNEDSDGDTIIPGAFTKTIQEIGPKSSQPRGKHLRNHLIYEPVGKLLELYEDAKGLGYVSEPGTNIVGVDTVKMIESGLITEHSFGYDVVRKTVVDPNADWRDRKQVLQELKFWEGSSLTGWGANQMTGGATMKAFEKQALVQMLQNRADALEKFCRTTTASDSLIETLLMENKQLSQYIIDLSTYAAEEAPTPDNEKKGKLNFSFAKNLN